MVAQGGPRVRLPPVTSLLWPQARRSDLENLALPQPGPPTTLLDKQQESWLASGWGTVCPFILENEGKEDLWWRSGECCVRCVCACVCARACVCAHSLKSSAGAKSLPSLGREFQAHPGTFGGVLGPFLALGLVLGTPWGKVRVVLGRKAWPMALALARATSWWTSQGRAEGTA